MRLGYEIAILLPESGQSAASLLALAPGCVAATTVSVTVATFLFGQQLVSLMNASSLTKYLWLLPVRAAATSAYSVFQFWAARKKTFTRIARTRIEKSVESEVFAIFGLLFYSPYLVVVCRIANVTFAHIVAVSKGTLPLLFGSVFLALIMRAIF